ncbi:MAG: hypothetical protein EA412_01020 [Chitinophagaceae bacterium]|nr:MAG: hypothetical protein EA412_01020 [Chitinophagaceae bacterium]
MNTLIKNQIGILPEIQKLDLERIKWKLRDTEEGESWTHELCDKAETEYKKFLTMVKLYPKKSIVPNKLMDKMWHQHILDTRAYRRDTKQALGRFLDHYPYFGMHGEDDKQNLNDAFEETKVIYENLFETEMSEAFVSRCTDHPCHAPSSCACRAPGACK